MKAQSSRQSTFLIFCLSLASTGAENGRVIDFGCLNCGPMRSRVTRWKRRRASDKSTGNKVTPFIVGGTKAKKDEFPWIAKSALPGCTASQIHSDILVTAAHCQGVFAFGATISAYNTFNPMEGSQHRDVDMQVRHRGFDREFGVVDDDIMLIRLDKYTNVTPVALNSDPDEPESYAPLTAAGFGIINDEGNLAGKLQKVDMHYVPPDICRNYFRFFTNVRQGPGLMCASARDRDKSVCSGDSGGPLLLEDENLLVGVISFGSRCSTHLTPNGFARVSHYHDWIQEKICEMSRHPPADCPPAEERDPLSVPINITVKNDYYSWETTWAIRDRLTDEIEFSGPIDNPSSFSLTYTTVDLLPGIYAFEVYDRGDDGMVSTRSDGEKTVMGWFEISTDLGQGKVVLLPKTNGNFTETFTLFFSVPEREETMSPSVSATPSQLPSLIPSFSQIASDAPSYVPSELPSGNPSDYPSFVPSVVPSDVPSVVPSAEAASFGGQEIAGSLYSSAPDLGTESEADGIISSEVAHETDTADASVPMSSGKCPHRVEFSILLMLLPAFRLWR